MNKDWKGNPNSTYTTIGASNHSSKDREKNDYYATDPKAVELLCELETFHHDILEPSCGEGHISKVLISKGYNVTSRDLINRGFGDVADFLNKSNIEWGGDIITNPPYRYAQEFIQKALDIIPTGNKVAMFLRLQFLEGKSRKQMYISNPPKVVYVSSSRLKCAMNGDFENYSAKAMAFAWFVWEKGYKGDTIIKWFN